jgi:hypothetical protein
MAGIIAIMKQIKFRKKLADMIIAGDKTSTWRLFDDKGLKTGDVVKFVVWETKKSFGTAKLEVVYEKTIEELGLEDEKGHEHIENKEKLLSTYSNYYKRDVNLKTAVKVIRFDFTPL